jgi:hypothetical protein
MPTLKVTSAKASALAGDIGRKISREINFSWTVSGPGSGGSPCS